MQSSSKPQHTPGPWIQEGRIVEAIDSSKAVLMGCEVYGPEDEALANARLIAAAPELLEALDHLIEQADLNDSGAWHSLKDFKDYVVCIARQAIAKATGEQ